MPQPLSVVELENLLGPHLHMAQAGLAPPPLLAHRYVVQKIVGKGARGLVCKGRDVRLDRDVAVQLYPAASTCWTGRPPPSRGRRNRCAADRRWSDVIRRFEMEAATIDDRPPPTQPCGVCGAPRPVGYVYCRSCSHYDTWAARRPLPATLRQIVVGTVLVGLLSYLVNFVVDRLIESSDEQAAARGLLLREYEDAHGELGRLREGLVRYIVRSTQAVKLCAGESSACLAELAALRVTLRQELLVFDWNAPLAFSLNDLNTVRGSSLVTGPGSLGPDEVERAIDTAANLAIGLGVEVTALDEAWSACRGDGCEAVADCRELYAQAETYCVEYVACAAFEAEADLRARIIEKVVADEAPRRKYSSSYCRDRPDVPAHDRQGVLATRTLCGATAATEEKACEILERLRPGLDVDRRCPLWAPFRCKGASPVSASTLAREAMPPPPPDPAAEPPHTDAPSPSPMPDDAGRLVPPGGRPPRRPSPMSSDASLVPPGGGPRR